MHNNDWVKNILNRKRPRILAFGSSNTQRRIPGMHWFDVLELAYNQNRETPGFFLNGGIGGETVLDLLNRFETDALPFKPHMALITIGGNDANPDNNITAALYKKSLSNLISSFLQIDTLPVLQTYYAPDPLQLTQGHAAKLSDFMAIKRELAQEYEIPLIDQFSPWCQFRDGSYDLYRSLMLDGLHINETGNLLMGLYLTEFFNLPVDLGHDKKYNEAREVYNRFFMRV